MPPALFPALLTTHVVLAVSLVVPAFILAFTLRTRGSDGEPILDRQPGPIVRVLIWLESHGTVTIGAGVAVTGVGLLLALGGAFLDRPWLLLALGIYAAILLVSFFVQRPALHRLLGVRTGATEEEKERWRTRARRQRYISYMLAAGIGVIGWLMMSKPSF